MSVHYQKPNAIKRYAIRVRQNIPEQVFLTIDAIASISLGRQQIPLTSREMIPSPSFFIVGSGRSGNTLLRRLLMEQFDTFIPPEIPGLGKVLRTMTRTRSRPWRVCVDRVVDQFVKSADISVESPDGSTVYNLLEELNFNQDFLRAELVALPAEHRSLQGLLAFLYRLMLQQSSYPASANTLIGDKTPWNVYYLKHINRYLPDAKIVHIVRHPLAVAYSYRTGLGTLTGESLESGARRWVAAVNRCMTLQKSKNTSDFTTVSYEALVKSPMDQVQAIARFLSLQPHVGANSSAWAGITASDSKLVQHKRINQPVDSSSIEMWKREITPELHDRMVAMVRPAAERLARETGIDYTDSL